MIVIDKEFQSLIPPLTAEEKAQLEANLVSDGCRDPLVVWGETLIDGHNRYEICTRLGLAYKTVQKEFESRAHARVWMRNLQAGRRNLGDAWQLELALGNKADLLEIGKAKQSAAGGDKVSEKASAFVTNDKPASAPHDTRKEIAKVAGVSTGQVAKAEIVKREAPELWEKAKAQEITIGAAYTQIKKVEKQKQREEAIAEQTKTAKAQPTIEQANAIDWLKKQEMCDLLLTDPPYSTDVEDIKAFANEWLPLALSKVKDTGRAFIFVGAYPEELAAYLSVEMPEQILVWTYRNTLGPTPSHNYKLNWQAILYYRGVNAPELDCPVMVEQFSVQDINAPDGRQGDRYHAWQKPLEIADRFIRHSTKEGEIVLDPFACTGTFLVSAAGLGRVAKGCDISAENIAIAGGRGCQILQPT